MKINEWMSDTVLTVKPLEPITRARQIMVENRVNQLPVMKNKRIVGIVTDRDLRDAFPSAFLLAWTSVRSTRKQQTLRQGVQGKGFKDTQDWQKAITSVTLAQGFLKKGDGADMDKKIAELEANPQIPAAYKQRILGMLKAMRPSDNNITVVKGILADPTYAKKIAEITK